MKFRTFISTLAAFAGLLIVVGLGLLAGLTLSSPLSLIEKGGQVAPEALQFVPKQSPLVASVLARPDRLSDLWQYLAAPPLRQEVKQDIQQLEQTLLAGTGLSYNRDLSPWIGDEITAAVVASDLDQNLDNGRQPGYLVIFKCNDSQAAKAVLELFWQNRAIAGDSLTFEDFSGTRLIYSQTKPALAKTVASTRSISEFNLLATALVANRFVLVANSPDVLRQALTAAQSSDLNLQADRRYRQALQALPEKRIGLLAFGLPIDTPWSQPDELDLLAPKPLGVNSLGQADNAIDWGLMSLALSRQGIVADVALTAAHGHRLQPRQVTTSTYPMLAQRLPDQLAIAAAGQDLEALWETVRPLLTPYEKQWESLAPLADRLDDDLANQVKAVLLEGVRGDYAVGMQPRSVGSGADWLLITEHNLTTETTLQQLTTLAQAQGLSAGQLSVRNHPATVLTRLSLAPVRQTSSREQSLEVVAEVAGLYAQVDDLDVLTASPGTLDTVLALDKGTDRTQSVQNLQREDLLRQPNAGYVYIDWPALQFGLSRQNKQFRLFAAASKPLLKHLKTVTLTSYGRSDTLQTGAMFLELSNGS